MVLPDGAAVIATVRDGLFRIDRSGAVTAHAVAGPIAFAPGRVYVSDGAAVIDDDGALWRRVADRWEALTVPATITRATEVTFVPQPHGAGLVAVDTRDGLRMLAWGAGGATVVDHGPAEATYPQVVGVGDEVWRVGAGTLWRWQPDGTWQEAGHYLERDDDHPRRGDVAMPVRLAGAQVGAHRLSSPAPPSTPRPRAGSSRRSRRWRSTPPRSAPPPRSASAATSAPRSRAA